MTNGGHPPSQKKPTKKPAKKGKTTPPVPAKGRMAIVPKNKTTGNKP